MDKPLTLKQLVQITAIDQKTKDLVLNKEKSLTAGQKYKISRICWRLLATTFNTRLKTKEEEMLKEMAEGISNYNKKDFQRAEDEVIADFLIKMDNVKTKENMVAVKSQLQKTL